MTRALLAVLVLAGPLVAGARPGKTVDVSAAFRSVEVPDEARLSGQMFLAVKAVVDFRATRQKSRLRPGELVLENFVFKVEKADCPSGKAAGGSCLEVSMRARLSPGEDVVLDRSERKLGRFAAYLVRERDHTILREALGSEPPGDVP